MMNDPADNMFIQILILSMRRAITYNSQLSIAFRSSTTTTTTANLNFKLYTEISMYTAALLSFRI